VSSRAHSWSVFLIFSVMKGKVIEPAAYKPRDAPAAMRSFPEV
jgi:hypothetical protein